MPNYAGWPMNVCQIGKRRRPASGTVRRFGRGRSVALTMIAPARR